MANLILVTGGTGTVGRVVVQRLLDAGQQVRVFSRGRRPTGPAHHVIGDVRTGEGLAEAVAGVDTIVACVDPARRWSRPRSGPLAPPGCPGPCCAPPRSTISLRSCCGCWPNCPC